MGQVVISVLSEMRRSVPVEASQRIDQILADLRGIDRNSTDTAQPVDIDGDGIPDGFFEFGQPMFINPEVDW